DVGEGIEHEGLGVGEFVDDRKRVTRQKRTPAVAGFRRGSVLEAEAGFAGRGRSLQVHSTPAPLHSVRRCLVRGEPFVNYYTGRHYHAAHATHTAEGVRARPQETARRALGYNPAPLPHALPP